MIERVVNGRIRAINMECGHGDGSMEINPHVDCPMYQSTDSPISPYTHCSIYHQLSHTPITPYTHCAICPLPHFPIVLYAHFLYFHCTTHRFPPIRSLPHIPYISFVHCFIRPVKYCTRVLLCRCVRVLKPWPLASLYH